MKNNLIIWNSLLTGNGVIKAQTALVRFWLIVALGIIAFAAVLMLLAIVGSYIYKKVKGV